MKTKIVYHIFADQRDEYTTNKKKAYQIYKEWCKDFGNVRLWTMEDDGTNVTDLDCIESQGCFPM